MEKVKEEKLKALNLQNALLVKLQGRYSYIVHFINDLLKLYSRENIVFSAIMRNKGIPGYHIFINILMDKEGDHEPNSEKKR